VTRSTDDFQPLQHPTRFGIDLSDPSRRALHGELDWALSRELAGLTLR